MKKTSIFMSLIFTTALLASCDQLKSMTSKNQPEDQKKINDLADQVAEKLALQAKMQQEKDQEIEAEVQRRLAAQEPAKAPERVVIKEVAKETPEPREERASGYINLYTDGGLSGRSMKVSFGQNINTTDGGGFKDNISSAEYSIPSGWQIALYEDSGYSKKRYVIKSGNNTIEHLPPYMNDKVSSIRWEKAGQ